MNKVIKAVMVLIFLWTVFAKAELANPGFEETYQVDEKTLYQESMKNAGWKFEEPLVFPMDWRTNPGAFKNGEYRLITGAGNVHGGENCVYIKGHFMHNPTIDVTSGDELGISFHVKDPGKKPAGVCLYFYEKDEKGKTKFAGSMQFNVKTEDVWSKQTGMIKIPEEKDGKRVNAVIIALFSDTGAYFDDVELEHKRPASWLNFQDAWIEGNKKFGKGNFFGAREDYMTGLGLTKERKERIDSFLKIAESYREEKNYSQEIETLNTVLLKEGPDAGTKVDINLKISEAYINLKDYGKARETLAGILKMGKESEGVKVNARLRIADTWLMERKYAEAIDTLGDIFSMEQARPVVRVAVQFKIGDAHVAAGDYEKARESYAKVLSMPGTTFVDKFDANRKTGDLYRNEKNYEKAREFYVRALNVEDVNPWSEASLLGIIGDVYATEGNYGKAREFYAKIVGVGLDAWSHVRPAFIKIGDTYGKEGNYAKAREIYTEMVKWAEENLYRINIGIAEQIAFAYLDMYRLKGDSYWDEGIREKAQEYYMLFLEGGKKKPSETLIKQVEAKIGENKPAEHIRNARALFFERKYREANAEYAEVLKLAEAAPGQKAVAHMETGNIYIEEKDHNKAREEYKKALLIKGIEAKEKAEAYMMIGDSYSIEQNYKKARGEYAKVLAIKDIGSSQKIDAQEKIAEMYRAECDYAQAKAEYGKILDMEGLTPGRREEIKQRILTIYR
ncbi:MAG TPA: tetratricopeptide repeat protein [bacterium]|nr:tetratricopeptide repeat protein [bacterium]